MYEVAKTTCLSVIYTGVKIFQKGIINSYAASYNGSRVHYETSRSYPDQPLRSSSYRKRERDQGRESHTTHLTLLNRKKNKPSSMYRKIKISPFYFIMHDGIEKSSTEFNEVYLQGVDSVNKTLFVPFNLSKIRSGVNSFDAAEEKIKNISSSLSLKLSLFGNKNEYALILIYCSGQQWTIFSTETKIHTHRCLWHSLLIP